MKLKISVISAILLCSTLSATQIINLKEGWNLIGIQEKPSETQVSWNISSILNSNNNIEQITNITRTYTVGATRNSLSSLEAGKGYWVKSKSNTVLTLDGIKISIDYVLSNLETGWSLIDIPQEMDTIDELNSFNNTLVSLGYKLEVITNITRTYSPSSRRNSLTSINVNSGYWIKVQKQIASKTYADGKVKVVVYSDKETNVKPDIKIDDNGNVTISGAEGVTGTVGILVADGDSYKEVETYSLVNGIVQNVSNNTIAITNDIINQAVVNKVLYSVYYAPEGSAPVALSNVDVFDKDGNYIGSTDSAGRIQVPVTAGLVTFSKDGYASLTAKVDNSASTAVVFLTPATASNVSNIGEVQNASGRILGKTLYSTTSDIVKTIQNTDGSFVATFTNFELNPDINAYVKLALLDESSININDKYHNLLAFGVEYVSVDENGFEKSEVKTLKDVDYNDATSPKIDVNITLSNEQVDLIKKAENNLTIYEFDGTGWVESSVKHNLSNKTLTLSNLDRFTQYVLTFEPKSTVTKNIYIKDSEDNNVTNANVIIQGKSYEVEDSNLTYNGVIPSSGYMNVEVIADGYEYFNKKINFSKDTIVIKLKKKATTHKHYIVVKDKHTNEPLTNAKVTVQIPVTLSTVRAKDSKFFVGKADKALYTWKVIDSNNNSYIIKENKKGLNYLSLNDIYSKLKSENASLLGDFTIKTTVKHTRFTEEGEIAYLSVDVDIDKVIDKNGITASDSNAFQGSLKDYGWVVSANTYASTWILSCGDKNATVDSDTLIMQDIATFIKTTIKNIPSDSIKAYPADSDGNVVGSDYITIPVNSSVNLDDALIAFYSTTPASSIPSLIDTTTDSEGAVDLSMIDKNLEVAIYAVKDGYKPYSGKWIIDPNTDENKTIKLDEYHVIRNFTINFNDGLDGKEARIVIPNAYVEEVTEPNTNKTVKISRDIDENYTISNNTVILDKNLLEGVKNLKIYVDGYYPYDNLIRVSSEINSTNVHLSKAQEVISVKIPEVAITYAGMIDDKFILKGQISDTGDESKPYSKMATLSVILNGSAKTYPINDDGSFAVSLTPVDGINKAELIVTNQAGKFDSGEYVFEYYNFEKDISDIDKVVNDLNETVNAMTADSFVLNSVFKNVYVNNQSISRGSSVEVNGSKVNIGFDFNQSADIYYITPVGEKEIDGNLTLTLNAGFNPFYFEARNSEGIVLDSFDFVINATQSTAAADVNVTLNVKDLKGNSLEGYNVIVFNDIDGKPGYVVNVFKNTTSPLKLKVPCFVSVEKEGYIPSNPIKVDNSTTTLDISLASETQVNQDISKIGPAQLANYVTLNGDDYLVVGQFANFWLDSSVPVDPNNFGFVWRYENSNHQSETINECNNQPFCSFIVPNLDSDEYTIYVDVKDSSGNQLFTKSMEVEIEKPEGNNTIPPYYGVYIPEKLDMVTGQQMPFYVEFYNVPSVPQFSCKDTTVANINTDLNSTSYAYFGDVTVKALKSGRTTCYIKIGNEKISEIKVNVASADNINLINAVYSDIVGKVNFNKGVIVSQNEFAHFDIDLNWNVLQDEYPNITWTLKDENGNVIETQNYDYFEYYFDTLGNYVMEINVSTSFKDEIKEFNITVNNANTNNTEDIEFPPSPENITGDIIPPQVGK